MAHFQQSIPADNTNITDFRLWAGTGGAAEGIAGFLSQLGFVKQADAYTAQWTAAVATGAAALMNNTGGGGSNLFGTTFPTTTSGQRTALASTHFNIGGGTAWVSGHSY